MPDMELREASEKRRHRRQALVTMAFARKDDDAVAGVLRDVSAAGARIIFESADSGAGHGFRAGDRTTVVIEGIADAIEASVTRVAGDEVAVAFHALGADTEAALARGIAEAVADRGGD